jgi:hypothetical protein
MVGWLDDLIGAVRRVEKILDGIGPGIQVVCIFWSGKVDQNEVGG